MLNQPKQLDDIIEYYNENSAQFTKGVEEGDKSKIVQKIEEYIKVEGEDKVKNIIRRNKGLQEIMKEGEK